MKTPLVILFLLSAAYGAVAQEMYYKVLFEYDKYEIPDSAMLAIVKIIHKYPVDRVLLEGHCDSIGSKGYNYVLSDNRANEVKKLLVQNGIPKGSIKKCIGYGKDRPIAKNYSEEERQLNRRVQITFYLKDEYIADQKPVPKAMVVPAPPDSKPVQPKREVKQIAEAKAGEQIVLENILFQPGRHIFRKESFSDLELLLDIMERYPSLEIEIQGHVCCTTSEPDGYDWDLGTNNLSEMRAREVYLFLIKNGIEKERLQYSGFGGTRKVNRDESTEELRKMNRRVEIKILKR